MEVRDIYNILLHILFLFGILSVLFWKIISKEMDEHTQDALQDPIKDQISHLTDKLKSAKDTEPLYNVPCNIMSQKKDSISKTIQDRLGELKSETPGKKTHNDHLKKVNLWLGIGLLIATILCGIWLSYSNHKKTKAAVAKGVAVDSEVEFYTWWRIILINIGLFIGVGICEVLFFLFIAGKYVPIGSSDASNSVIEQLIESFNNQ